MDLGATVCTRRNPDCPVCPLRTHCAALRGGDPTAYPKPRERKNPPTRQARMFVIADGDGFCLLRRRPARGVWASLWSPPQYPPDTALGQVLTELALDHGAVTSVHHGPTFQHGFTHYTLSIEPIYVQIAGGARRRLEAEVRDRDTQPVRWHHPRDRADFGLSAVAVKLIDSIADAPLFGASANAPDEAEGNR